MIVWIRAASMSKTRIRLPNFAWIAQGGICANAVICCSETVKFDVSLQVMSGIEAQRHEWDLEVVYTALL